MQSSMPERELNENRPEEISPSPDPPLEPPSGDLPAVEVTEPAQEDIPHEVNGEAAPPIETPPPRRRSCFWTGLRWLLVSALFFGLGVLAAYMLLFIPTQEQVDRLSADLTQLQSQISTLEADQVQAQNDVNRLEEHNQVLRAQTEAAIGRALLLQALNDVNTARFDMATDNPAAAVQALEGTDTTLEDLSQVTPEEEQDLIGAVRARLSLVIAEAAARPETAASDLEILRNLLLELEQSLLASS